MGAGTGPKPAGEGYEVVLNFNEPIWSDDVVVTNFESALEWVINARPCRGTIDELPAGPGRRMLTGIHVKVTFSEAFDGEPRARFNRAMNRVLWGVRHRRRDGGIERPGAESWVNVTSIPKIWDFEET